MSLKLTDPVLPVILHMWYTFLSKVFFVYAVAVFAIAQTDSVYADPVHGAAMHGTPLYGKDFTHFNYVNPDAPKGGRLTLHATGTYDTFNPFTIKGTPASGIALLYDTLTYQSLDEPFSQYGLLAQTFEIGEDRDWVTFNLHPEARFSDGRPVTAADVAFTFDRLINDGSPFYRNYYADVAGYTIDDDYSITFQFTQPNPELALILGQLAILPRHFWEERDFEAALTDPPIGSGPYVLDTSDLGKSVTYARNTSYWGRDLPVTRGMYNFDRVTYTYFLDGDVAMEAFKSHEYDFRRETSSVNWATEYDFPALKAGKVHKELLPHSRPSGMQAFIFNIRRELFQDPKVRQALSYAFDFEWSNANLFYGAYTRTKSFFENSELASRGLPSKEELELLEPLRDRIPSEVFTAEYVPPSTKTGNLRANLRKALQLLRQAGWVLKDGELTDKDGNKFTFEILLVDRAFFRVVNPMAQNLARIGIEANVSVIEITQYVNRLNTFAFDMIIGTFGQSNSPGNEQRDFWGSQNASVQGSRNWIGIQNPAVDALVEKVIFAEDRDRLITATRALDRVLLWNYYVIPQWHISFDRVAWWDNLARPKVTPANGVNVFTWWAKQ